MADLVAVGVPIYCGTAFIAETLRSGGQANRATLAMKNRLTAPFGKTGYAKIRISSRAPSLRSLFECGVGRADFLDPLLGEQASSSASKGERAVRSVPIALPGRREARQHTQGGKIETCVDAQVVRSNIHAGSSATDPRHPHRNCCGRRPRSSSQLLRGYEQTDQTTDAIDTELPVLRSRGRSVVALYKHQPTALDLRRQDA
jgi:hypothetical protein